jgi:hypothetical protein
MAGMHLNPNYWWLLPVGMVAIGWLVFFCHYRPDCATCQFLDGFN